MIAECRGARGWLGVVQREVGGGEDVGGAEAGADPGQHPAGVVPLEEGPLEALRVERVGAIEPGGGQGVAELFRAHRRRRGVIALGKWRGRVEVRPGKFARGSCGAR
jgi:hypothetical protein